MQKKLSPAARVLKDSGWYHAQSEGAAKALLVEVPDAEYTQTSTGYRVDHIESYMRRYENRRKK